MENIKHCYIAIGLLHLSNQEKKAAKFAVQVCGSEKSFAVAEVQEITANLRICGCGPPIAILRNLPLQNRVQICGAQHWCVPAGGNGGLGLLRLWIKRFTMIISAWWLRTSSTFNGQKFERIHKNFGSSETPKQVRIPPIMK